MSKIQQKSSFGQKRKQNDYMDLSGRNNPTTQENKVMNPKVLLKPDPGQNILVAKIDVLRIMCVLLTLLIEKVLPAQGSCPSINFTERVPVCHPHLLEAIFKPEEDKEFLVHY